MRLPAVEGTSWGQTHHQPPSSFTVQEPSSKIGHSAGLGGNRAADREVVAGPRAEKTGQPLGPSSIPWANSEQNIGWKGLGSPSEAPGGPGLGWL